MAEHVENSDPKGESLMEKIADKFHGGDDSSSSSDSDTETKKPAAKEEVVAAAEPSSVKDKVWRLFGREKPVHKVFGGGKRTVLFSVYLRP